jgi:hypothetical protein
MFSSTAQEKTDDKTICHETSLVTKSFGSFVAARRCEMNTKRFETSFILSFPPFGLISSLHWKQPHRHFRRVL